MNNFVLKSLNSIKMSFTRDNLIFEEISIILIYSGSILILNTFFITNKIDLQSYFIFSNKIGP